MQKKLIFKANDSRHRSFSCLSCLIWQWKWNTRFFFFVRFEIRYTLSLAGKILLIIVSPSRESVSLWIKITNILTSEDKTCVSVRVEDAMTHVTHSRKNLDSILSVSQWRCVRVSIYFPDSDGGSPLLRKSDLLFQRLWMSFWVSLSVSQFTLRRSTFQWLPCWSNIDLMTRRS